VTKFCVSVDIHDLITCATFVDDRLRGLGVARDRISSFPIDLRRRPYNTRTTVRVCDLTDFYDECTDLLSLDVFVVDQLLILC